MTFHNGALCCVRFLFTEDMKCINYPKYFIHMQKVWKNRKKPNVMKTVTPGAIRKKYTRSK